MSDLSNLSPLPMNARSKSVIQDIQLVTQDNDLKLRLCSLPLAPDEQSEDKSKQQITELAKSLTTSD